MTLWLMLLVGFLGTYPFVNENSVRVRVAGAVWCVIWWLPPMTTLWIKGVFG